MVKLITLAIFVKQRTYLATLPLFGYLAPYLATLPHRSPRQRSSRKAKRNLFCPAKLRSRLT